MNRRLGGKRKSLSTWPAVETLFFIQLVRAAGGVQDASKVENHVSTQIVIAMAVNKEEWG